MRVGGSFVLKCIATNDPQSPNMIKLKWFRGLSIIDGWRSSWTIVNFMATDDNNKVTLISRLLTTNKVDHQYNGRYTCSVYDSISHITQSTNVIVEGKQLLLVT